MPPLEIEPVEGHSPISEPEPLHVALRESVPTVTWNAFVNGRFLRPTMIVSVDVAEARRAADEPLPAETVG